MKKTYEIAIQYKQEDMLVGELIMNLLFQYGFALEEVLELTECGISSVLVYFDTNGAMRKLANKLKKLNLKKVTIRIQSLTDDDWKTKWKKDFKPFMLTKRFKVVPSWLKKEHKTSKIPIYVDTSLAFGTGLHATTQFMAQFIDNNSGKFDSLIDIGTGTGILAIIARKCGATHVAGLDISEDAVKIAAENMTNNDCVFDELKAMDFDKYQPTQKYDYVAANLITDVLIDFKSKIIGLVKKGGYLAVSGISVSNYEYFRKSFKSVQLRCVNIEKGNGWSAILFKKM
ncbi:MAG: ribosomal protein L11 methyltransferase [Lysobacterales bacterium]|jgi:ribosomal protein L11 methyltransferase